MSRFISRFCQTAAEKGGLFKRKAENSHARASNEARFYGLDERRHIFWTNYPCKSNHGSKIIPRNRAVQPRKSKKSRDRRSTIWSKFGRRSLYMRWSDRVLRMRPRSKTNFLRMLASDKSNFCASSKGLLLPTIPLANQCYSKYRLQKEVIMGKWR